MGKSGDGDMGKRGDGETGRCGDVEKPRSDGSVLKIIASDICGFVPPHPDYPFDPGAEAGR
jgi:hypothetical protein